MQVNILSGQQKQKEKQYKKLINYQFAAKNKLKIIINEMGNENITKDPNIQIYLELKSLIYRSGSKVKGCIYLQSKEYSSYSDLILRIECFQKTENKQRKDKNNQIITEERRTYLQQLKIAQFFNGFYKGQYQFPFSLVLPQNLPGSLLFGKNEYIRYRLTAYLQSCEPSKSNQLHERQIWILQKFQKIVQPVFSRQLKQAKCCMWGYSYGNIQTQIQCETNNIQPGQKVRLKFQINTRRMNSSVKKTRIRLIQKMIQISGNECQQKQLSQLFAFDFNQSIIQKGQIKTMEKNIQFPVDILPTAIGQILSRYYIIEVHLWFSCKSQIIQHLHIFVSSSKNELKQQNKGFSRSNKWKPIKYEKLYFKDIRKYQYKPHLKIPFLNTKDQITKLNLMNEPYPQSQRKLRL